MKKTKKPKIETAPLSVYGAEELACKITGLDYDEIDADEAQIEDAILDKFNIGLEDFTELVRHLLPLIQVAQSPISKRWYKGFADDNKQMWLAKMAVEKPKK